MARLRVAGQPALIAFIITADLSPSVHPLTVFIINAHPLTPSLTPPGPAA